MEVKALRPKIPPEEQELVILNGDEAVAYAVKQSLVDVVSAYPITPQTIIVERISEYVADGVIKTEFVPVESEHSAMSVCIGAAATGARAFTATSSQGLALMVETLYIASALRLPIVMAVANRALSAPINIHNDHSDAYLMRDSGWVQLFVENVQEAYDTTIQAFRIAEDERALVPVAVNLDGFFLSHMTENVRVLPDKAVEEFLGGHRKVPKVKVDYYAEEVPLALNPARPLSFGNLDLYDFYFEHKVQQNEALRAVPEVVREVNRAWHELTGRSYGDGVVEPYGLEDADVVIVAMGSGAGTFRDAVRRARARGEKVGLLKLRLYRPFPHEDLARLLGDRKLVAIAEKGISLGSYGPLFLDLAAALYGRRGAPELVNYIYGLGGRDLEPELALRAVEGLAEEARSGKIGPRFRYLGVRG
ncbi:MAG: pyruvate ferredoxin oxidoreductase [Desulfurococcaceae archaeon]